MKAANQMSAQIAKIKMDIAAKTPLHQFQMVSLASLKTVSLSVSSCFFAFFFQCWNQMSLLNVNME